MDTFTIYGYVIYLVISLVLTVWVARTLFRNGRVFLVDAMRGNAQLADSVNHLLVVGFYLINVGYVSLMLKYGTYPRTVAQVFEHTSTKVGTVLLVLGAMHFLNLYVFSRMRRGGLNRHNDEEKQAIERQHAPAPKNPQGGNDEALASWATQRGAINREST